MGADHTQEVEFDPRGLVIFFPLLKRQVDRRLAAASGRKIEVFSGEP